jgi:hypothetical protein
LVRKAFTTSAKGTTHVCVTLCREPNVSVNDPDPVNLRYEPCEISEKSKRPHTIVVVTLRRNADAYFCAEEDRSESVVPAKAFRQC